jgi:hypothetical protein
MYIYIYWCVVLHFGMAHHSCITIRAVGININKMRIYSLYEEVVMIGAMQHAKLFVVMTYCRRYIYITCRTYLV